MGHKSVSKPRIVEAKLLKDIIYEPTPKLCKFPVVILNLYPSITETKE